MASFGAPFGAISEGLNPSGRANSKNKLNYCNLLAKFRLYYDIIKL